MHGGGVSSGVEAVQTMVDRMKTALEEAQANLSIGSNTELKLMQTNHDVMRSTR